jgi:hypothetical protein
MAPPRDHLAFWAASGLLLAGSAVAWLLLLGPGAGPAPVRATAPERPPFVVVTASGRAEVVRPGGGRAPLASGDALSPEDAVATGPDARVELAAGESYRVVLDGGSRLGIEAIGGERSRFRLEEGLLSARVRDDESRAVEIASARDAVARTHGGDLSVARSGPVVAVGVARGQAEFRSGGRTVVVHGGEQSAAADGGAPAAPAPIPASLLLKVAWPEEPVTARRSLVVTGRTAPGAVVAVGAEPVDVAADGSFRHEVALSEGSQRLSVTARDVGGRRREIRSPPIVVDTDGPATEFDTNQLWGAEKP